jgi:hypothetical protein
MIPSGTSSSNPSSASSQIHHICCPIRAPRPLPPNAFSKALHAKAGAFYCDCAVVNLRIPSPATADATDAQVPDDRKLMDVHLGHAVWEGFEGALKEWEKVSPPGNEKAECDDIPPVDTPSS